MYHRFRFAKFNLIDGMKVCGLSYSVVWRLCVINNCIREVRYVKNACARMRDESLGILDIFNGIQ